MPVLPTRIRSASVIECTSNDDDNDDEDEDDDDDDDDDDDINRIPPVHMSKIVG